MDVALIVGLIILGIILITIIAIFLFLADEAATDRELFDMDDYYEFEDATLDDLDYDSYEGEDEDDNR